MACRSISLVFVLFFVAVIAANGQLIGFRFAGNTNVFLGELGDSPVPHPDAFLETPAVSSTKFSYQPTIGAEAEILFQASEMSLLGVELEYSKVKGYNDIPPVYNYYLTPYYAQYQDYYTTDPVAFNTTLFNVAVNWKYFFFKSSPLKPFVKLTGVVAFVATDFTFKDNPDPELFTSDVLYARGTSNSEQNMWPAFHLGGGIGFDYMINDKWSFQVDATSTVINSDIINGVPNFTYEQVEGVDMLSYQKNPSVTFQISAGVVYYIELIGQPGVKGKADPSLPFYRKK